MKHWKTGVVLLLVIALAVVILQNRDPVETHFLWLTFTLPRIVLLALTALAGFVAGILVVLFTTTRAKAAAPSATTRQR